MSHGTSLAQADADPSFWYVLTKSGQLYSFDNSPDADVLRPALDIGVNVTNFGEYGALGLALHPEYPSDPRVFIVYNDSRNESRTTLSSFVANTETQVLDENSEQVILSIEKYQPEHVGGDITFGTDGYLYLSVGDDGWGTSLGMPSQDTSDFLGSILRIDINTTPYSIPNTNPFAENPRCDGSIGGATYDCPEIFAWGFRNPWRISIDKETNILWVGDVGDTGSNGYEEINRISINQNYGWPDVEGFFCTGDVADCNANNFTPPVLAYPWDGSAAVIGGYVYRGERSPTLVGKYIYADYQKQNIYVIDANENNLNSAEITFPNTGRVSSFAQAANGEIYSLNYSAYENGDLIYHIVDSGGVSIDVPERLSETGCFDVDSKTSAVGVFDYDLNSALWSDGANKLRSFAIPDGTTISVDENGDFLFPEGSILIKHFLHNDVYLETRLLIRYENGVGWRGYSYEWDEQQQDALLVPVSERRTRDVGDFVHQYPNQNDCSACHSGVANSSLGIELAQQNRYSDSLESNIIDYLNNAEYFSEYQNSIDSPRLYSLNDENASIEQRARSYLHSNCSGCHRPEGSFSVIDLRYDTPLANTNLCDVAPTAGDIGLENARRIAPGAPENSVLLARMQASGDDRMPPLGTLNEDIEATTLIANWILGISACE